MISRERLLNALKAHGTVLGAADSLGYGSDAPLHRAIRHYGIKHDDFRKNHIDRDGTVRTRANRVHGAPSTVRVSQDG